MIQAILRRLRHRRRPVFVYDPDWRIWMPARQWRLNQVGKVRGDSHAV